MADNAVEFKKVQIVEEDEEEEVEEVPVEVHQYLLTTGAIQKELQVVNSLKDLATNEIKKGMNMVAVNHLMDALRKSWKILEQLQKNEEIKQIKVLRAQLLNNVALCYMN